MYSANSARSSTTFGLRGNDTSWRKTSEKDGIEGGIENITDLVMFCHCLPIVNEKDFQNLRHIQLHFRLLVTLLLPNPNESQS
jgi:hypothetical protein